MEASQVITPIAQALAATALCAYMVGFYKKAFPEADGKFVVAAAILSGLFASVIETAALNGLLLTQVVVATVIGKGIVAAALSAGIQATNESGDAARVKAGTKTSAINSRNP